MHEVGLAAQARSNTGKGAARSLRREGKIPAVLYGRGRVPQALAVESRELGRLLDEIGGEAALVDVTIDGAAPLKALVREVQRNPVKRTEVIHLDLYAVVADQEVTVVVPVRLTGTPEGVKNQGGVLDHHLHRLTIRVLPGDIPMYVEIDVSHLTVGHAVHISDLAAANYEVMHDDDVSIASVIPSRAEEVVAAPVTEAAVGAEPEVIKKGKADEAETAGE